MLLTFLHLAARKGEVFRLKRSDLDFAKQQVRLWTRKTADGSWENAWIPMTTELAVALKWWIKQRMAQQGTDQGLKHATGTGVDKKYAYSGWDKGQKTGSLGSHEKGPELTGRVGKCSCRGVNSYIGV